MKKNITLIYFIELVILIFILIFKFLIINKLPQYIDLSLIMFFTLLCLFMIKRLHLPIDKNYKTFSSTRLIIICLLSALILVYTLGLIMGFTRTIFTMSFLGIIKNILPIIILLVCEELIRFIIVKNSFHDHKPIIYITILFILLSIITEITYYNFYKLEDYFIFICVVCLPLIAKQLLYSYTSTNISLKPTLLLRISFEIFPFIFPIYPNLGNYIVAVIGISLPFIIYEVLHRNIQNEQEDNTYINKAKRKLLYYPLLAFLILIVCLVSGLFRYKMIAIGSNSMKQTFARGDAVIYRKYSQTNIKKIKVGDVLVFTRNTLTITHRVKKIKIIDGKYYFTTKGDNNAKEDLFITPQNKVLGIIKYRIKYIGYPTIWLFETFNKSNG
jgi:signal peptidase